MILKSVFLLWPLIESNKLKLLDEHLDEVLCTNWGFYK